MSDVVRSKLADWLDERNRAIPELGREPRGFRDLMWCPYLNEPAILEWRNELPHCPNCDGNFEASTHAFIGHVGKPRFA
jgi:hypothetical protein